MNDGYLSKDREYLNKGQRDRRARLHRIDYMPCHDALEIIESTRGPYCPVNTYTGMIDRIVILWAEASGIKYGKVEKPKTSVRTPELIDQYARANDFGLFQLTPRKKQSFYCGAKTKSGKPCRGKKLPHKNRCKWHGGCSTGPKTSEGKAKALANLRQNRVHPAS